MSFSIVGATIHTTKIVDIAANHLESLQIFRSVFKSASVLREMMKLSSTDIALSIATELVKRLYQSIDPFLGSPDELFPKYLFEKFIHA